MQSFLCHIGQVRRRYLNRSLIGAPLALTAAGIVALSSGCGSGQGTSFINPPVAQTPLVSSGGTVITTPPVPGGTPTPGASANPTPSPSPSATPIVAPTFTVAALNDYNGNSVNGAGLNNSGQVTATTNAISYPFPLLLYTSGAYQDLGIPSLNDPQLSANGLNDAGNFVGSYNNAVASGSRPFVVENNTFRDLGVFSGRPCVASAINNKEQIVGYVARPSTYLASGQFNGYLYDDGNVTDLGFLSGATASDTSFTNPLDINDSGQIVGESTTASGKIHAFLWENGTMRDLAPNSVSRAAALNNKGQAVGYVTVGNYPAAALFENGGVQTLTLTFNGVAPTESLATGINEAGQIVGLYLIPGDPYFRGFFYDHGVVVDLNALLPDSTQITQSVSVNNKGQVLVVGAGSYTTYLLTPITKAARVPGFTVSAKPAAVSSANKKN